MKRQIITIDEEKCTGCGDCVPNCHEGALQIIDGKARLISDLFCDGLGACIGHCPEGAIEMIEREAEPYDEILVINEISKKGKNTVTAHLKHLKEHGEHGYMKQAVHWMEENRNSLSFNLDEVKREVHGQPAFKMEMHPHQGHSCPGSAMRDMREENTLQKTAPDMGDVPSELRQWPVQMHLVHPQAPYFRGADVVIAADCVAFSMGDFHQKWLKGKSLAIACPKLDSNKEIYLSKMQSMIDDAKVNMFIVMVMEVPCCSGLIQMVKQAQQNASRKIPVKAVIVSIKGEILEEEWI